MSLEELVPHDHFYRHVEEMNIRITSPPLIVSGRVYPGQAHLGFINPLVVGAGALTFSLFPISREKGMEARDEVGSSPAAYL